MKYRRLFFLSLAIALVAVGLLMMRVGYPYHRLLFFAVCATSWVPLFLSYRVNRQYLRERRHRVRAKTRPYLAHAIAACVLLLMAYVGGVLMPVVDTPLSHMTDLEIREAITTDINSCIALNDAVQTLLDEADERGLLRRRIDAITPNERRGMRQRWRDGIMAFYEYELIKSSYRGFHNIDYIAKPSLHADAFFTAYAAYVSQYNTCLRFVEMVGDNEFVERRLNEPSSGVPANSYALMKQRLTHPDVLLRLNAGTAYFGLVKKDFTVPEEFVSHIVRQKNEAYRRLGRNPDLFIDNPLDLLESLSFKAWYPLQKHVALQMSRIRTAQRDYFISPSILAAHRKKFQPGDVMVQRRNWHLTNIGIPGFWPHAAMYVGTLSQIDDVFADVSIAGGVKPSEHIRTLFPNVYEKLSTRDADGHAINVLESIRPGVILQSLEKSAHADYLGVIRPNLSREQKFQALLEAFRHYGKPYDFNFDFSTDNALVCSELVFKAFQPFKELALEPNIVNGRLILAPNLLVELFDQHAEDTPAPFDFVLFLDANEAEQSVTEGDLVAFRESWSRPKWDIMQK